MCLKDNDTPGGNSVIHNVRIRRVRLDDLGHTVSEILFHTHGGYCGCE